MQGETYRGPHIFPAVVRSAPKCRDRLESEDSEALAACFTPAGTVLDAGVTYTGHDEIVAWRESLAGKFTYTSRVDGTEAAGDHEHLAFVHIEGDFPGGVADLKYRFALDGDLISGLTIGG